MAWYNDVTCVPAVDNALITTYTIMSDVEYYEMDSLLSWNGPIDQANNQEFYHCMR